jgi:hypothetical protein
MSFVTKQLLLNHGNPPQPVHRFKLCAKCEQSKPPEGGIDMNPTRWICATCWTRQATRRKS